MIGRSTYIFNDNRFEGQWMEKSVLCLGSLKSYATQMIRDMNNYCKSYCELKTKMNNISKKTHATVQIETIKRKNGM